jgi:DNA-binding MarR family transcriptional regulator
LLSVSPGKDDQRAREVSLTSKGLKQLKQALPLWNEAQRMIRQSLGTSRIDQLLGDLNAVVDIAGSG